MNGLLWLIIFILSLTLYKLNQSDSLKIIPPNLKPFQPEFISSNFNQLGGGSNELCGWQPTLNSNVLQNETSPIQILPIGASNYPPNPNQSCIKPPLWKWKHYINYYYYDPYFAYSYPYNQFCDAMARRNCNGSWETRTCFRGEYNKCIEEKIY